MGSICLSELRDIAVASYKAEYVSGALGDAGQKRIMH